MPDQLSRFIHGSPHFGLRIDLCGDNRYDTGTKEKEKIEGLV